MVTSDQRHTVWSNLIEVGERKNFLQVLTGKFSKEIFPIIGVKENT